MSSSKKTNRSMMSCSCFPNDLWGIIFSKLTLPDKVRFRAVCKSWRSALPPPPPPPRLLLCEYEDYCEDDPSRRHFMFLGKQKIYKVDIPEIHRARCVGSTGNWLITAHKDETIRLTDLFSRFQIHLPKDEFRQKYSTLGLLRVVSSSSWPMNGRNCIVMAMQISGKYLIVARPGDTSWTIVERENYIVAAIFFNNQLYVIDWRHLLMVCEVGNDTNPPKLSVIAEFHDLLDDYKDNGYTYYLVEWLGELLVVIRKFRTMFKVYKFDFTDTKLDELMDLEEHSLFLGYKGNCFSVLSSDYVGLVRKNSIYFIDIAGDRKGLEVRMFDLEDQSNTLYYKIPRTFSAEPVWVIPTATKQ